MTARTCGEHRIDRVIVVSGGMIKRKKKWRDVAVHEVVARTLASFSATETHCSSGQGTDTAGFSLCLVLTV